MKSEITVTSREASEIIQICNQAKQSETFYIQKEDKRINARSMLGILSIGIKENDIIEIVTDKENTNEAVKAELERYFGGKI